MRNQMGIEAHGIEIIGNIAMNSCDFFKVVHVYPYTGELGYYFLNLVKKIIFLFSAKMCGYPIVYSNQTIFPKREFYFTGQSINYHCTERNHALIGYKLTI